MMTLVFLSTQNAHLIRPYRAAASTTFCAASVRSSAAVILRPRLREHLAALLDVRALRGARRRGTFTPTSFAAAMMPSAITSHRTMPPKMLTRIAFTLSDRQNDLERLGDPFLRRAAADVEEVRGLAAVQLDDVHRRHREAGAVDQAADVAVERDVVEVVLAATRFGARLPAIASRIAASFLWRNSALSSKLIFASSATRLPSFVIDQRVDLDQRQSFSMNSLYRPQHDLRELIRLLRR